MLNWYAISVKSRHEFVTKDELERKHVETFVPTVRKLRQWKDRKKLIDFPVFPGYLFVHLLSEHGAFLDVLKTRGVVRILSTNGSGPIPVSPEEIESLKLIVNSETSFDIYPHLQAGRQVRIRRGPLTGAVGTLEAKDEQSMFHVNVELLGRSIGVRIYADDLEAA